MKKRALLTLLPFALVVTGCSGSLKKSSIFNKKFLDMNIFFGMNGTTVNPEDLNFERKFEFESQKEEVLDLGSDVTPTADLNYDDLLVLSKADGSKGYYNLATRKMAVPVEKWKADTIEIESVDDYGFAARFFEAVKVEDEKEFIYIYDEFGNKVYSGESGVPSLQPLYVNELQDNVGARVVIYIDGQAKAYATYAVDFSFIKAQTVEEFVAEKPYAHFSDETLARYGHPELIEVRVAETDNETRYSVFNTKKEKYISSFSIPKNISGSKLHFGDCYYYQIVNEVHEREKKYDYNEGKDKFNVETYCVNYVTGKVSTVKTNILFKSITSYSPLVDEKGAIKYMYVSAAKFIEDKTINPVQHNLILGDKLDIKADVSGMSFTALKKFGDYYRINGAVYDSKMREVGYIDDYGVNAHIVGVDNLEGIVDHTGKYLVEPIYDEVDEITEAGDYFILYKDDTTRVIKLNEKEEVVDIVSFTNEDYLWSTDTSSRSHQIFEKVEDSKFYVLNLLDGTFTPQFEPETGDVLIVNCEGATALCDTIVTDAFVFQRGSEYRVVYTSTHVTNSLPENFAGKK